jgi:hypothetical protein
MARTRKRSKAKRGAQGGAPASRPGTEPIHPDELLELMEGEAELYEQIAKTHGLDQNNPAHRSHIEIEYRRSLGQTARVADVLKATADRRSWQRNTKPATDGKRRTGKVTRDAIKKTAATRRNAKAIAREVGRSADHVRKIRRDRGTP